MKDTFENPAKVFRLIVGVLFFLLFIRLFQLQVIENDTFNRLAEGNAAHVTKIPAPRGIIYDRYGKVVVSNKAVFTIYAQPVQLNQNPAALTRICEILDLSPASANAKVRAGLNRPFEPLLLKENLSLGTVTKVEEQKYRLPGIFVRARPARYYPFGLAAAHLLGYLGEITREELEDLRSAGYKLGDNIGKAGVEKYYDPYLKGVDGGERIEVDVFGRVGRRVETVDPLEGNDLKLTIDIELQAAVRQALLGKKGAVVVLDPQSGEILALESSPTFDPAVFSTPLEYKKWLSISRTGFPFLNRALSVYPAGSIFKVVNLAAVLSHNYLVPESRFNCPGYFNLGGRIAHCWKAGGHGNLSLFEGLVQSCDVVFYQAALKIGPELLAGSAREFGLGEKIGVDLPGEAKGSVPSPVWKKEKFGLNWYPGDTINFGIGQGFLQVSPLQMAAVYSQIVNGGIRHKPCVVREIADRKGNIIKFNKNEIVSRLSVSAEVLSVIKDALTQVVERGTGRGAKLAGLVAGGKTGTAEDPPRPPHAWFICFAPADNPQIVISVFIEQGEHGDRTAAHTAKEILQWYKNYRFKLKS